MRSFSAIRSFACQAFAFQAFACRAFACQVLACLIFAAAAQAQSWPQKPIRIVAGFPPGPMDIIGRPIAAKLQQALGVNVIFENRPGANGAIATEQVARGEADGYTLLLGSAGTHATAVHLVKNLRYDPIRDFEPVIALTEPATCLVVNPSAPFNNVAELIAYAKAHPGELSYGTPGTGSVFHLAGELFNETAGVRIVHVPYKGGDAAMNDLLGNHIPIIYTSVSTSGAQVESGKAKLLAILEPHRFAPLPNVPSISETLPAFQKPPTWFGFFVARKTPPALVLRLNSEIAKIIETPEFRALMAQNGSAVLSGPPEKLRDIVADGVKRFGELVRNAGIEPE